MKKLLMTLLAVFSLTAVFAQSNDFITQVIGTKEITYGQAAYLLMCDRAFIAENASESDAISALEENFPALTKKLSIQKVNHTLTAKEFSFLCSSVYDVKSSLMYLIFHNKRYAFRQMKAAGYFAPSVDPKEPLDGRKALIIIADLSEKKDATSKASKKSSKKAGEENEKVNE